MAGWAHDATLGPHDVWIPARGRLQGRPGAGGTHLSILPTNSQGPMTLVTLSHLIQFGVEPPSHESHNGGQLLYALCPRELERMEHLISNTENYRAQLLQYLYGFQDILFETFDIWTVSFLNLSIAKFIEILSKFVKCVIVFGRKEM